MLWTGPSAEVTAALGNPVALKLHRRAGRQSIAYNLSHNGRTAEVFRMEKSRGQWFLVPLGTARGADPLDTFLNAALEYTEHDDELVELATALIEQRIEALAPAFAAVEKRANTVLSDLRSILP
jgi:hypothetical protein